MQCDRSHQRKFDLPSVLRAVRNLYQIRIKLLQNPRWQLTSSTGLVPDVRWKLLQVQDTAVAVQQCDLPQCKLTQEHNPLFFNVLQS